MPTSLQRRWRPDSSVGRATDWKSVCRRFDSASGHHKNRLRRLFFYLMPSSIIKPIPVDKTSHNFSFSFCHLTLPLSANRNVFCIWNTKRRSSETFQTTPSDQGTPWTSPSSPSRTAWCASCWPNSSTAPSPSSTTIPTTANNKSRSRRRASRAQTAWIGRRRVCCELNTSRNSKLGNIQILFERPP